MFTASTRLATITGTLLLALWSAGAAAAPDHYESALTRFEQHDYEGAVVELKAELSNFPDNLSALVLLGRAYLRTGYAASAEQALEKARAAGADDALTLVPLARAYTQQGKYEALLEGIPTGGLPDALKAELVSMQGEAQIALQRYDDAKASFERAGGIDPLSPAPWRGKARLALARGRHHAAASHSRKAIMLGTENEETWFLDAEAHRISGRRDSALKSYGQAISLSPRYVDARVARAATLIDLGRADEASADIEHVLAHHDKQPQALYLKASLLARDGKMDEAASVLDKAANYLDEAGAARNKDSAPMMLLAGVTANAQGRLEVARARLEQFIAIEPKHAPARRLLGSVLVRQGDAERAIYILKPALSSETDQAEVYATLGLAYRQLGNFSEAIKAFEKAIQNSPDPTRVRIELARTRFAAGDPLQATAELESIAKLDHPLAAAAGTILAKMQLELGKPRESIATTSAMLARDPRNLSALLLQGDAQVATGDMTAAIETYNRALALEPENLAPRYGLANANLALGKTAGAAAQLETILERDPNQILAMVGLARVAMTQQQTDDAIRWLHKARATNPSAAAAHLQLVQLHLRNGDTAEALTAAQKYKSALPDDPRAHVALGRSQVAEGDHESAKATYAAAASLPGVSADSLTTIARGQIELKDVDGARKTLAMATTKDVGHLEAQALTVSIDLREGNIKGAMSRASSLRRRYPQRAVSAVLLGDVMLASGDHDGAIKAYLEAVDLQSDAAVQVKLHNARWQAGQREAAVQGLEAWVASNPDDREAARALAGAYLASGRLALAQSLHERLLATAPEDSELLNNLAWLYQTQGDERALQTAKSAYTIAPKQPSTLDTYGWILLESGQPDQALKILRQAQALAPREPWVQFHTAMALSRLGRRAEARELLENLLASKSDFPKQEEARALLDQLRGG